MTDNRSLIGIDAGTSAVKAVAFDEEGNEVCLQEAAVPLHRPERSWVEQDMNELWATVKDCLGKVVRQLRDSRIELAGIGITSTGDGTWMIDRDGNPVRRGILWCDGRASKIIEEWHSHGIARESFKICGTAVFTGSQAAQLYWLREAEPASLASAAAIFHAKDWLFFKLTGIISSDETDEPLTMLRMSTREYDPELFRIFGIEDLYSKFPVVKPTEANAGPILPALADCLGKPVRVPAGSQFGAKGAALNVGVASGYYPSAQESVKRSVKLVRFYEPEPANAQIYQELYQVYQQTAARQMDLWDLRTRILSRQRRA